MSAATLTTHTAPDTEPAVARIRGVTKEFGTMRALDDVSFELRPDTIYGLLGRNGAGKTTLMQIMTGQAFQTSGEVSAFGAVPHENRDVLEQMSFVKESQRYPDDYRVSHVVHAASRLMPRWSGELADRLLHDFDLPMRRKVKKLSRGMTSALGVTIGLASRAPLTFFDEPYLGLDAVARHLFYDRLLEDYAEHPRTVVLSTHLIDEVGDLLEHVLLLDHGRLIVDASADSLRGTALSATGPTDRVDRLAQHMTEMRRETLGGQSRVALRGTVSDAVLDDAARDGVHIEPLPLQQLVVDLTSTDGAVSQTTAARKDPR
ncbi:ABC transporter ATP-binding protein [Rhodococcus sp. HNM0569]|uniref:ABC transporter ATP-binding protein n=1 Tax=Rhodococcus sp. HNM0569 TaxID=2716340 RepID=UPI00146B7C36|nr:ABC transporter ATP-binding protein [Rhodococcus sp. HNM0569]NLU81502.1 ABC transporter ATP-binding protein [Rhodococcus sp. HNM0569]